jgi:anti-sigma B factor antagonist
VLIPCGELDFVAAQDIRHRVAAALGAGRSRLIVDLSQVTYMESTAIAALLDADASARRAGGCVTIVLPPDARTRLVFELTQADRLLKVLGTRDDALRGA